uniref:Lebercilin domain-containing protein n=1 Tax=Trichobilharzia regenti TaxID=157069 RepID=A0AA85K658_TRIRE|nr:unnamed protein product [Trichobilharzia regenti]
MNNSSECHCCEFNSLSALHRPPDQGGDMAYIGVNGDLSVPGGNMEEKKRKNKQKKVRMLCDETHCMKKRTLTLQQILTVRRQKIYEQQCEIEQLRGKVQEVCNENKFLRDQNFWQTKALEKLDGKHAELPQLINNHLEEIRVFREQIRRMKSVLKVEKRARHEAETSREKILSELKHLRKLAEDQKLLEREESAKIIEKLQAEAVERGKLLTNLEKYAENLEKNQRFESLRLNRSQKEMKETCQKLVDRIEELEQVIQEKQKLIELSNIYSKRITKQHLSCNDLHEIHPRNEKEENFQDSSEDCQRDSENNKQTSRERIKEFDLKRQRSLRRKTKLKLSHAKGQLQNLDKFDNCGANRDGILRQLHTSPKEQSVLDEVQSLEDDEVEFEKVGGISRKRNSISLPKILRSNIQGKSEKRTPETSPKQSMEDEETFRILRCKEHEARLIAEANVQMDNDSDTKSVIPEKMVQEQTADLCHESIGIAHSSGSSSPLKIELICAPSVLQETKVESHRTREEDDIKNCCKINDAQQKSETLECITENCDNTKTKDVNKESVLCGDTPDNYETKPEQEYPKLHNASEITPEIPCPSGDVVFESKLKGVSPSSDEEILWQNMKLTINKYLTSEKALPRRIYRGPQGLVTNNELDGFEEEYITENTDKHIDQNNIVVP